MADEEQNQEEAMAAMMAEMDDGGDKSDSTETEGGEDDDFGDTEALSQDEIDSLLGFGDAEEVPTRGVEALIYRTRDNYEKFPMLEVVFDRFSRSMSSSLRNFTGETSDIIIENVTSVRFEDYLNSIPLPAMLSIFQAVEWENVGLMTIDSSLVYSLIDILLGGAKSGEGFRVEGRPFTAIEQDIIKNFSRLVFEEISQAFTPITTISFRMDRLETNPRFVSITRPANLVVIVSCRIEFDDIGGKIDVVFPYSTLEPIKEQLTQMFSGESFGNEVSWEAFLSDELKSTNVKLKARLKNKKITLKDLASMEIGSTLITENNPEDEINVTCNDISIFKGKLGSYGDKVAISLTDTSLIKDLV
jgi:flagellar motor switch protein FliM